jgi:hypothetical protein
MRRSRIAPYSAKRRKRDAVYAKARVQVFDRADGRCEAPVHVMWCSGQVEQVHHVAGRGGSDPHRLENLLGLSRLCHEAAHAHPGWAYRTGVSVRRHGVWDDEGEAGGAA